MSHARLEETQGLGVQEVGSSRDWSTRCSRIAGPTPSLSGGPVGPAGKAPWGWGTPLRQAADLWDQGSGQGLKSTSLGVGRANQPAKMPTSELGN